MAHPYHHALSSLRQWGGSVEDYQRIHGWFDESKMIIADFRHRALRHHARSEEHTSELQSQSNLVCRLLLEKKKKIQKHNGSDQRRTHMHLRKRDLTRDNPFLVCARVRPMTTSIIHLVITISGVVCGVDSHM